MSTLDGKVAIVTGGASGLGLGTARALAARGARVVLLDIDEDAVTGAAASIGGDAMGLAADIADRAAVDAAVGRVVEHAGSVDVVVANAGIVGAGMVRSIEPDRWTRTIEVNVLGTFHTVQAVLPHLLASRGYLLLVASGFAAAPGPYTSAYAASKAAIESLGRSLRIELHHHGIDVGVAYYSFLDTPMVGAIEGDPAGMRARAAMPAPVRRTYPLEDAVAATVVGIERRADRVIYPRFLRWQLLLRGALGPKSEGAWRKAMPEVERLSTSQS
jgi:NAD(P)-dependent dehydrogenase (short-subunit alcohol dehydrogenase family)